MRIVRMSQEHVPQIAQLEKECFSTPWSEASVAHELTNPLSLWLVALVGNTVIGYVGSQSVLGEADMMNVAVRGDYRRRGIAEQLVKCLICELAKSQVSCLTLEVRASNEAAISLYCKLQFEQVGRRPNYYEKPKEDAVILRREW